VPIIGIGAYNIMRYFFAGLKKFLIELYHISSKLKYLRGQGYGQKIG
jgi:hypothetical protein